MRIIELAERRQYTSMSESYIVKGALIPCDGWCAPRDVLIRDGVIAAVEAPDGVPFPPPKPDETRTTVECANETRLLMPGLHNAHSHSSNFFNKGSMAQLPLEMMAACRANLPEDHPWKNGRRSAEAIIERYRLGALAIGLHNLMSGATSVIDMIALPDPDPETGDDEMAFMCLTAAAKGYRQSGVRVFLGPHLMDSGDVDGYSGYAANFLALVPEELRDDAEKIMKTKVKRLKYVTKRDVQWNVNRHFVWTCTVCAYIAEQSVLWERNVALLTSCVCFVLFGSARQEFERPRCRWHAATITSADGSETHQESAAAVAARN